MLSNWAPKAPLKHRSSDSSGGALHPHDNQTASDRMVFLRVSPGFQDPGSVVRLKLTQCIDLHEPVASPGSRKMPRHSLVFQVPESMPQSAQLILLSARCTVWFAVIVQKNSAYWLSRATLLMSWNEIAGPLASIREITGNYSLSRLVLWH
ncbi:hypothetical protein JAAARDRAFT_33299 [Jaapia argillacea MUCL 33604]|uniref:Uncharacterized protein n=1 Tax=Jaapia argillacea MUCL 33604 TaxID=933084 RepID=A0A067Q8A3_9AGAM|nr:hypothetical protein JAAARDRAFT_33299 [Jaapia argillacea MUCL 33604]